MSDLMVFVQPLLLTIMFECSSAVLLFRIKDRRDLAVVLLVNIITNPLLVYFSSLMVYHLGMKTGRLITFLVLEPLVIAAEYVIYGKCLLKDIDCLKLSIVLNLISIMGGLICQRLI